MNPCRQRRIFHLPKYNQTEDNKTVTITKTNQGFTSFLTVIYGKKAGDMSPIVVSKIPVRSEFRNVIHVSSHLHRQPYVLSKSLDLYY